MPVDLDLAAVGDLDARTFGQQVLGGSLAAHGHQQLVHGQGLLASGVGVAQQHLLGIAAAGDLGLADLGAQLDVQTLLLEFLQCGLGHFGIGQRQEVRQRFENGDFGTQTLPHAAQLQADDAGADDGQTLGNGGEIQAADVVDDGVAIELGERQFDRFRTGRQDHVCALERDLASFVLGDLDDVARLQLAEAVVRRDLVGLEQHRDAAGELLHDLVLAADHGGHVHLGIVEADAVVAEQVTHVPELARGIQQRLGWNATHTQAGAAQRGLAVLAECRVDAGDLHAQLGRANRRVIAGRASTDDDDVVVFSHF